MAKKKGKQASRPARRKATSRAVSRAKPRPERRDRSAPESLRLRSAAPGFTVNDIQKSLAFYRDVLGFHVKERWERDGALMGVELVAGSVTFYISQDDWKKGRDRVKGEGFRVYCETGQGVDQLAARIKRRGASLLEEPQRRPWGSRDFAVADPDGFKITFSTETKG